MTPRRLLLIVLALTFAGGFRSLFVGHLSDDWAIISHISRHGNSGAWTGPWLGMPTLRFHRPVFTGLYALDFQLFGTNAFPAHAHHLLWHLAATALLFAILKRWGVDPLGAAFGSLVFGIHPYLPAATGWLAGRCGSVAGTLTLLTVWAWQQRSMATSSSPWRWQALAVLAAGLAVLTRESGYLALVAPLMMDVFLERPKPSWSQLIARHAPFAVVGLALLALRWHALGTLFGGYPKPDGVAAGSAHLYATLKEAGLALAHLVGGVPTGFIDGTWHVAAALGIGTVTVLGLGLRTAFRSSQDLRRPALVLAVLFVSQLALLLVSGPTLHPSTGQRWYGAIAFFAALLGMAAGPLLVRARLFAPLFLLPIFATGHIGVQNDLLAGDRMTKRILAQAKAQITDHARQRASHNPPVPLGPIFISCLPESQHGIPTMQWAFSEALRPPFEPNEPPSPIYAVHRFMYLGMQTEWMFHPPVEPLLHIQGKFPLAIGMAKPFMEGDDVIGVADIGGLIDLHGNRPPLWPAFGGKTLEVLHPPFVFQEDALISGTPLKIPLKVETLGCTQLEFFFFLPTVDMRFPMTADGPALETDFGWLLEDYIRFRQSETVLYTVVIAHRKEDPRRPYLSPAIKYRWKPD